MLIKKKKPNKWFKEKKNKNIDKLPFNVQELRNICNLKDIIV